MAETKTRFPGFVGPAYTDRVARFDAQEAINMYLEADETGGGKGGEPAVMIATPGLDLLQTIGTGPIRASYTVSNQEIAYIVSGSEVYQISGTLGTPILLSGTLGTSIGPVSVADNGIQAIFVDGTGGYYVSLGDTTLITIVDPNFYPADVVTFQDGYFILNQKGTPYFFLSDLYSIDFPALNTAAKSGNSDILIAAYSNSRQLYLFGAYTTEIWWNAGVSGTTPFQRQDGRFSQVGCAAPNSIARLGETLCWLGTNAQGGGIVYMLDGTMPSRISNHAVEFQIQQLGNLSGAVGYGYQEEGHYFYVLNIPGNSVTWVYDTEIKQWHKRQSTVNGFIGRTLAQNHCFLNGKHILGDYNSGNIYTFNYNSNQDNGENRLVLRRAPAVSNALNMMFLKLVEVDCQFGVGLVDDTNNPQSDVDPRIILRISRDGAATWGNPIIATMGKIGQYLHRARWQRLGKSRDFVLEVSCTDNVRIRILSAYLDLETGYA